MAFGEGLQSCSALARVQRRLGREDPQALGEALRRPEAHLLQRRAAGRAPPRCGATRPARVFANVCCPLLRRAYSPNVSGALPTAPPPPSSARCTPPSVAGSNATVRRQTLEPRGLCINACTVRKAIQGAHTQQCKVRSTRCGKEDTTSVGHDHPKLPLNWTPASGAPLSHVRPHERGASQRHRVLRPTRMPLRRSRIRRRFGYSAATAAPPACALAIAP